ncbi:branched-chain amino acid ABC transporter permease [Micromonospora zhanjiangensis]|uniref:Branched-chain amino acid ABC transporter permease n=1 Tax=Micromonospora zhanjiangensis TaxID=1522057 RepID=A0ABV8KTA5_9ACTN
MTNVLERLRSGTGVLGDRWQNLPRPARWVALVLIAVFFYALPNIAIPGLVTTETDWATTLFTVSYYVLLALGLNVVVGKAGLLDLGYVGFFALGAYTTALLASDESDFGTKWSWAATVPVAIVVVMISGVLLGWPTLRLRGDYLAIVTLGFAEIIRVIATATPALRGQRGIGDIPHPPGQYADGTPLFGVIDARPYYWLGLTLIIIVIFAVRNLDRSRVGRAWVAVREDEEAAEAMGVPTFKFKLWAFAIGAAIGSLSGVMFAGQQGFINSKNFDLIFSILILAGVVMGGSGNIVGVIVGGALIAYLPERLRGLKIGDTDAFEYRFLLFGAILILIMIFRPQGLIPNRRRTQELKDREKEVTVGE